MPLPSDLDLINVVGKYVDLSGSNVTGTITFTMTQYLESRAVLPVTTIAPVPLVATINAGSLDINLPATDDPNIEGGPFVYIVTEQFDGITGRTYNIELPYDSVQPVQLADLAPAATPEAGVAYLTQATGDTRYTRNFGGVTGHVLLAAGAPDPAPGEYPAGVLVFRES